MDLSSNLIAVSGVVFLVLLWRLTKSSHKKKGKLPPEVPGGLPLIGHLHQLGGNQTLARKFGTMADKYGNIFSVRLGVHRAVVISNAEAMKECFTTNDKLFASRPPSSQAKYLGYNYAAFGFAPYGPYWRGVRKLIMIELLSSQRIKLLKHVILSEIDTLVGDLFVQCKEGNRPAKIDMTKWLEYLILNIITRMVAGKRYFDNIKGEFKEEGIAGRPIGSIMREFMFNVGVMVPSDLIPILKWVDVQGSIKTMKRLAGEMDLLMEHWIDEHKLRRSKGENADTKQDFIDVMLSSIEDDNTLGHKREVIIKSTAMSLIIAGSDTTSITLTWILSNLLNNRRALERAQEELDQKIGRDRIVEDSDVEKLEYLQAIIKESLRLYPPGPVSVPHEAAEDCYIGEYFIPKGTRLFTNLWKLQRDPKVWTNPEEFIPERFLTNKSHLDVSGKYFDYLPFGAGRRACPGLNFAMQVMQITLARLLQAFNWTTPNNEPVDMTEGQGIALPKATHLETVITTRLAPELYQPH